MSYYSSDRYCCCSLWRKHNGTLLMMAPKQQQQHPFVRQFRFINSFRLFLCLIGSCSMGWLILLIIMFQQQQTNITLSFSFHNNSSSSSHNNNNHNNNSNIHRIRSLLEFINASAGKVMIIDSSSQQQPQRRQQQKSLSTTTTTKKEEQVDDQDETKSKVQQQRQRRTRRQQQQQDSQNNNYHVSFPDCIYLLTAVFDNNQTTTTTTTTTKKLVLYQSLNGYWKHPVSIRRRHLTINLKLLQDAVMTLEEQQQQQQRKHVDQLDHPNPYYILWSTLQATSNYHRNTIAATNTTTTRSDNNSNDTNMDFFTTVPNLGIIPLIINWEPTNLNRMMALSSSFVPSSTTMSTPSSSSSPTTIPSLSTYHSTCGGGRENVFILRDAAPYCDCCGSSWYLHDSDEYQATTTTTTSPSRRDRDSSNNNNTSTTGRNCCCFIQQHLMIPNAPLILQVQAIEQQLLSPQKTARDTNRRTTAAAAASETTTRPSCRILPVSPSFTTTTTTRRTIESLPFIPITTTNITNYNYNYNVDNMSNREVTNSTFITVGIRFPSELQYQQQQHHHHQQPFTAEQQYTTWLHQVQQEFEQQQNKDQQQQQQQRQSLAVVDWEINHHEDQHDIILDFSFNWTLFCQPHVLILKVDPPKFVDMFTVRLYSDNDPKNPIYFPIRLVLDEAKQLHRPGTVQQDPSHEKHSRRNFSNLWESVHKPQAVAIWSMASQRQQILERKLCWCEQHMNYKTLVQQVLNAWSEYIQWTFLANDHHHQLWKEEFLKYAKGHFWKRPGGDSWTLPLSVVGGIKGGLRADAGL